MTGDLRMTFGLRKAFTALKRCGGLFDARDSDRRAWKSYIRRTIIWRMFFKTFPSRPRHSSLDRLYQLHDRQTVSDNRRYRMSIVHRTPCHRPFGSRQGEGSRALRRTHAERIRLMSTMCHHRMPRRSFAADHAATDVSPELSCSCNLIKEPRAAGAHRTADTGVAPGRWGAFRRTISGITSLRKNTTCR